MIPQGAPFRAPRRIHMKILTPLLLLEVVATGASRYTMHRTTDSAGRPEWFGCWKSPVRGENGLRCAVAGIARNITQHKKNEAALCESKRLLQSTLDALSAHIAM